MCVAMEVASSGGGADEGRATSVGPSARQSPKVPSMSSVPLAASPVATTLLHNNPVSPSLVPPRKIISKNANGTMVVTSTPSNDAELQLYRVMQRASLLAYYDTLLEMGGDDVQQLCDAGEEEFLEIMALVGMASKPLHVRRLQKSLQEWVTNPALFQVPLVPGNSSSEPNHFPTSPRIPNNHGACCTDIALDNNRPMYSPSPGAHDLSCALPPVASPGLSLSKSSRPYSPLDMPSCPTSTGSSPGSGNSIQLTPMLLESQISRLAAAAERLSKHLPQLEPKPQNAKKKMCKELELVMTMPETDPRRMEEIRRYAAIYGRFDCKRRPEKPLTLHEVSVNEAAAQICRFVPALLTRRDELFPLARQVVRDSGYHYSKTTPHISSQCVSRGQSFERESEPSRSGSKMSSAGVDSDLPPNKRSKIDGDQESEESLRSSRQDKISEELLIVRPSIHSMLQQPKSNLQSSRDTITRGNSIVADSDDTDSHFSFSNSSSPSQTSAQDHEISYSGDINNSQQSMTEELEDVNKYSPKVQVIAASGDNIIAVANPALAMSPTILPTQKRGEP